MPATPPKKGVDGGEIFQCFRPEFLKGYEAGKLSGCAFRFDEDYSSDMVCFLFLFFLFYCFFLGRFGL